MADRDRVRVPIVFGQGLDRETGIMVVEPNSFEDLRNVLLYQGKVSIRTGFTETAQLVNGDSVPISHIIAGIELPQVRAGVVVGYIQDLGEVYVFGIEPTGINPYLIGTATDKTGAGFNAKGAWFTLPVGERETTIPRVILAESNGIVYLCHDQEDETKRADTYRYNPSEGLWVAPFRIDTGNDGSGIGPSWGGSSTESEIAAFRGCVQHLDYLVGWGFAGGRQGSPTTGRQFRSEYIRISRPADPDRFDAEGYFIVGSRNEPVRQCNSWGGRLPIFKAREVYQLVGQDRATFGVFGLDRNYGIVQSQLAVTTPYGVIFWSDAGPRLIRDGPSDDLEIPLELEGYQPSGLPQVPSFERAFGFYFSTQRIVVFVSETVVYALTVRTPGNFKWSYWELAFPAYSGFTLYTGYGALERPGTGPTYNAEVALAGTSVTLDYNLTNLKGDELIELWHRDTSLPLDPNPWAFNTVVAAIFGTNQDLVWSGLQSGTTYEFAARYRRGNLYNDEYKSSNPSIWPDPSRHIATTTIDPPLWADETGDGDALVWERVDAATQRVTVRFRPAPGQEGQDVEIYRQDVLIATVPTTAGGDLVEYQDTGVTSSTNTKYNLVTKGTSQDSPKGSDRTIWIGLQTYPIYDWASDFGANTWTCGFDPVDLTAEIELLDDWDGVSPTGNINQSRGFIAAGSYNGTSSTLPGSPSGQGPISTRIQLRKETGPSSGVYDFSRPSVAVRQVVFP